MQHRLLLVLALGATLHGSEAMDGKTLFEQKCASCHTYYRPDDISTLVAPPIKGVVRHLRMDFGSDAQILQHIQSFVPHPTHEKAICPSVKRFGLMPSLKDQVSQEELDIIGTWMLQTF